MIGYADRAFCGYSKDCATEHCDVKLTDKDIERGTKWWGSPDFPVQVAPYKDTDVCPGFTPKPAHK
jgi:hypothetical protein